MLRYVWFVLNAVALVCAVPVTDNLVMTIQEAQNKTMCPFVVVPDIEEGRVPRVINHVKCVFVDTSHWCSVNKVPQDECCGDERGSRRMQCVQLVDLFMVTVDGRDDELLVNVGCACKQRHVSYAIRLN